MTIRDEKRSKKYLDVLLQGSLCSYEVDLTTGAIEGDLSTLTGSSFFKDYGFGETVTYDELLRVSDQFFHMTTEDQIPAFERLSRSYLLSEFEAGRCSQELVIFVEAMDRFLKNILFMTENEEDGHVVVLFVVYDVTEEIHYRLNARKNEADRIELAKRTQELKEANERAKTERRRYRDAIKTGSYYSYQLDLTEGLMTEDYYVDGIGYMLTNMGYSLDNPPNYDDFRKRFGELYQVKAMDGYELMLTRAELLRRYQAGNARFYNQFHAMYSDTYFGENIYLSKDDHNGHIFALVIGNNISEGVKELKRTRQDLESALERAERANAAKTAFLSRMSHDIRTPLNGIIGLIEMDERRPDDVELVTGNRQKAKVAAGHLLNLINDVLELSKLDDRNVTLNREAFNIKQLAEDVMTIADIRAAEAGITMIHQNGSNSFVEPYVYGSPLHLRQVILNIVSNAIKYNKPGGSVTLKASMIRQDEKNAIYECMITDTGIGMSENFIAHIYEPFSQERDDARSVFQGTGLGMAIVKSIVDKMGGRISVESQVGVGTTFVVSIPFELATPEDVAVEEEPKPYSLEGAKILLVEDNELNMEIAKFLFEDFGAIVTCASHGEEALHIFEANLPGNFDVILMDVMMPVMDGFEATRAIRSLDRMDAQIIPIIAMTANAFMEDREAAQQAGMDDHLAKPLELKKVISTVGRYVQKGRNTI